MQYKQKVSCLSTDSKWGKVVSLYNGNVSGSSPYVFVAKNITVEDIQKVINLPNLPAAVIVENGSFAGHPSVLLNAKGIQYVVIDKLPENNLQCYAFIDGQKEFVYFDENRQIVESKYDKSNLDKNNFSKIIKKVTFHGEIVKVNVDGKNANDLLKGFNLGADGIGILRTDWLGWDGEKPPSVEDHLKLYNDSIKVIGSHQLNIRLFDIGGDKIPNWAQKAKSEIRSPLGLRGIRSCDILKTAFENQLNAVAQISPKVKVGIVLPMISYPQEVANFKKFFNKISPGDHSNIIWGSMVETPSSALLIKELYKHADFVRIGPGDLSQFTLATLREHIYPDNLSGDTLNPAVIKLIRMVMNEAKKQNKDANMCLDVEPRLPLLKKLLAAGVRCFNVSPESIPVVKNLINSSQ
ncbi:MAG: putative PEP-binding protein [Candidatus Shapirobacteria bacterium]|jgi:phosphoenolpyruvate-protein kinase (PTS system EI component)